MIRTLTPIALTALLTVGLFTSIASARHHEAENASTNPLRVDARHSARANLPPSLNIPDRIDVLFDS